MAFDWYARCSYERLLLQQPQVRIQGLWLLKDLYYAVCPDLRTAVTIDGKPLGSWFDESCRVVGAPLTLVETVPEGAEAVPTRSAEELAIGCGEPNNTRGVFVDLHLALPPEFPNFNIDWNGTRAVVRVPRALSSEEESELHRTCERLALPPFQVEVVPGVDAQQQPFRFAVGHGDIELIPSRRLGSSVPTSLRELVEADDDYWSTTRMKILASTDFAHPNEVLPQGFVPAGLGCLVNASVFPPENIRNYLSLYDTVFLVAPLGDQMTSQCQALGVTDTELVDLIELGRVRLLLPQSLDRYAVNWLARIAEAAPNNVIMSRRLAAATVVDTRRRWPLFYPPLAVEDRRAVLDGLTHALGDMARGSPLEVWLRVVRDTLTQSWTGTEAGLNGRGAMGTAHVGVPSFAAKLYEALRGRCGFRSMVNTRIGAS